MNSVSQAIDLILSRTTVLAEESVPLVDAVGRVLSRDMEAIQNLPPFDNSAMDGYAVKARDVSTACADAPVSLHLADVLRAGASPQIELLPGQAIRIMTGAPVPAGADAIAIQEIALRADDQSVTLGRSVTEGDHIRRAGEDVRAGTRLLKARTFVRPYEVALLAAQGFSSVPVIRRPRVGVVATGDELVDVGRPLAVGQIRNSNGPALLAALRRWGLPAIDFGIAPDEPHQLEQIFQRALDASDVLIVSGGVSVGDFDFTRECLERLGMDVVFWKVAMKPGKPLLFGIIPSMHRDGPKLVFGLPGNPVSALVCLEELIRPSLEKMQGHTPKHPSYHLSGVSQTEYFKPLDRVQFLFCVAQPMDGAFQLEIIRPQGSAMLGMASGANALAVAVEGVGRIRPGDVLPFRWLK
jgi:molybdopterin molybdotransferase